MSEPVLLSIDESEDLEGVGAKVYRVGTDGIAFKMDDGRLILATICLGCGSHIGYYEIDESMLAPSDDDYTAS